MTETHRVADFLRSIGIPVTFTGVPADSFLPGVRVGARGLLVYEPDVAHPHDLFHEAGHLAVVPTRFWPYLDEGTDFDDPPAAFTEQVSRYWAEHPDGLSSCPEDPVCRALLQMGESEAIAWSYAAMVAAGCDLDEYWGDDMVGFNGEGEAIRMCLDFRSYVGINGLQAAGMTTVRTFPTMKRWLQPG